MNDLETVAPAFVEMAHRIVWCSVATVDAAGRPRSRVLHPMWAWQDGQLIGWVGTGPTPTKRAHLEQSPYVSLNYWEPGQDTCVAECRAEWCFDLETRNQVWDAYKAAPPPLGYDPAIIPGWDGVAWPGRRCAGLGRACRLTRTRGQALHPAERPRQDLRRVFRCAGAVCDHEPLGCPRKHARTRFPR